VFNFDDPGETMGTATEVATCAAPQESSNGQEVEIRTVLSRRSDLSTFIVHLTRDDSGKSAKSQLKSIVQSWEIQARNPFGTAVKELRKAKQPGDSQKCVCFTETPLEYLHLLVGEIKGRSCQLAPYGVAITKKLARKKGVNPVWYVDQTPGHDWLTKHIDTLRDSAIASAKFDDTPFAKIAPFIEQMGTWKGKPPKEFWWEREWRHVGPLKLPHHVILICPDNDHSTFEGLAKQKGHSAKCVDADWGLEQIIARLAGFCEDDIEIL